MMAFSMWLELQQSNKQTLKITPQIKQSLHLLRLPFIELQKEIQTALENNPFLEQDELKLLNIEKKLSEPLHNNENSLTRSLQNLPNDSFIQQNSSHTITTQQTHYDDYLIDRQQHHTLHDHLYWQSELTHFNKNELLIAHAIIDHIDARGYLTATTAELATLLSQLQQTTTAAEIELVLEKIQQFDPTGVAARDLSECLLIQLAELPTELKVVQLTKQIVASHLSILAQHDYRTLAKIMQIDQSELIACIDLIRSLTPHPGECFQAVEDNYVLPDLIVYKQHRWLAKLNEALLPALTINQSYSDLLVTAKPQDKAYLASHLQQAQLFLNGLENRYVTLLKVTQAIIDHQWQFFEYGKEHLNPLKLADLAEELQLHESTISRATTQKYLVCQHGLFELKYFFSGAHLLDNGTATSSAKIKNRIKQLILAENKDKPISDNRLVSLLKNEGITLARRTVTKYREALLIAPSHQRKNHLHREK